MTRRKADRVEVCTARLLAALEQSSDSIRAGVPRRRTRLDVQRGTVPSSTTGGGGAHGVAAFLPLVSGERDFAHVKLRVPAGTKFDAVGILDHGAPGRFCLLKSVGGGDIDLADLASSDIAAFLKALGGLVKPGGRIDLLGCSVAAGPEGRALLAQANRIARRGGTLRLAVDARRLATSTVSRTKLDAVDLALHHGAAPFVYEHRAKVLVAA